jgi:hypothetical protein
MAHCARVCASPGPILRAFSLRARHCRVDSRGDFGDVGTIGMHERGLLAGIRCDDDGEFLPTGEKPEQRQADAHEPGDRKHRLLRGFLGPILAENEQRDASDSEEPEPAAARPDGADFHGGQVADGEGARPNLECRVRHDYVSALVEHSHGFESVIRGRVVTLESPLSRLLSGGDASLPSSSQSREQGGQPARSSTQRRLRAAEGNSAKRKRKGSTSATRFRLVFTRARSHSAADKETRKGSF